MTWRECKHWEHLLYQAGHTDTCTIVVTAGPISYATDIRTPEGVRRVSVTAQARRVCAGDIAAAPLLSPPELAAIREPQAGVSNGH